jgi:dihydrodipicolinate reductase
MSTAAIMTQEQGVPSLHSETTANDSTPDISVANATELQNNLVVKELLKKLNEQSDLVIDFSSLKTCLNPLGIEDAQSLTQKQVWHIK